MRRTLKQMYTSDRAGHFLATVLVFGVATGLFAGVMNNYLHEVLSIGKVQRGIVELPRELPGLLLVLLVALLYRFSEVNIMRVALLVSLAGMVGVAFMGSTLAPAIVMIVLWSTGEHLMMPVRSSIAVHMAVPGKEGFALGGVASTGMMFGHYLVPLLFLAFPLLGISTTGMPAYRAVFVVSAAVILVGLFISTGMRTTPGHVQRKRLYFRRRYARYYVLEVLFGARKQVFLTFAPYVLILTYGARPELISTLMGVAPMANIFVSPALGHLIDRIGYRTVIIVDTVALLAVCLLYGFTHRFLPQGPALVVISVVFVVDAMLFVVGMARTMYVKSLAESQDEVTSTLSTGLSINHLVSIAMAVGGGIFWARLGTEMLFSVAALFMVASFFFSLTLPKPGRARDEQAPTGGSDGVQPAEATSDPA
jgi:predicted MFS family arabinose efflux permease